jgi:hypothetical protein
LHRRSGFWAVTTYFNPIHYQRRLANYRIFRERLAVPLVTVELSQTGDYHLRQGDADVLIQLTCPDLLWQKERLLNIGLASLPPHCDVVAWLDCDTVFENGDWADRTVQLLEKYELVTPFQRVYNLPKDGLPESTESQKSIGYSYLYALETGMVQPEVLRGNMRVKQHLSSGLAGVGRKDLFQKHGFYDACVMGSGNRAMTCAALGRFDDAIHYLQMGPHWARHYLAWAEPFFESVGGKTGYLDEGIFHLWHGALESRRYAERHAMLRECGFDPARDLFIDSNGCWRWSAARNGLKGGIRRYFESRREDG